MPTLTDAQKSRQEFINKKASALWGVLPDDEDWEVSPEFLVSVVTITYGGWWYDIPNRRFIEMSLSDLKEHVETEMVKAAGGRVPREGLEDETH